MKIRLDKTAVKLVAFLVCAAILVFAGLSLLRAVEADADKTPADSSLSDTDSVSANNDNNYASEGELSYYQGAWYRQRKRLDTLLIMGLDKFGESIETTEKVYENNQQADFFLLLVFDKSEKTYTAIHINRDTMTDIQVVGVDGKKAGTVRAQLALSHTYGTGEEDSCEYSVEAVSNLLYGIPIKRYVAVTMDAVQILNDSVGGVEVYIEEDFSNIDPTLVQGQRIVLKGEHALNYVRSRGGLEDSTNLSRMKRQRTYLTSLLDKFQNETDKDSDFFVSTMLEVNDYMTSNCTISELSNYNKLIDEYDMAGDMRELKGEAVKGAEFMEYYVDEADLQKMMIELFYEKTDKK